MTDTEKLRETVKRQNAENERMRLEQEEAKRMADHKAEKNAERRFQIFLVFLTAAATLLVEHFREVVEFITKLFHG